MPTIDAKDCSHILKSAEKLTSWRVAGGEALESRVVNLPDDFEWIQSVEQGLRRALGEVYPVSLRELVFAEAALVRYCVGAKVPRHTDINPAKRDRVVSFVLYLTEGFEGGRLHVPSMKFEGIAPLGSSIVFPSGEPHYADSIGRGDKSVMVGFFECKSAPF